MDFSVTKNNEEDLDQSLESSVTEDIERQFAFLNDEDDYLNNAKLSLHDCNNSIVSEKSYLK